MTDTLPSRTPGAAPGSGGDGATALPAEVPRRARSPWATFALRRGLGFLGAVVALVVITFFIVQLIPGDPAVAAAGADATTAQVEQVRAQLGLDRPLLVQFGSYVAGLVTGDLGNSFMWGSPVVDVIAARVPFTLTISLAGIAVVLVLAVPLGMTVGILTRGGRHRVLDSAFGWVTGVVSSIPSYVMATLLVVVFAIWLAVLPPAYSQRQGSLAFVLPVVSLALGPVCTMSRVVRRETAVALEQDYVRTARGWRLPHAVTYGRYVLPNIITTALTLSSLILTSMLGAALITETVFSLPGLGTGVVQAILNKDYPVIQGITLFIGLIAAVATLLVDVLLGLVDPRSLGGRRG